MLDKNNIDWKDWSVYVIKTIEKLEVQISQLETKLTSINLNIQTEITKLKSSSRVTAAIGGIIASIIVSVVSGYLVYAITESRKSDIKKMIQEEYVIKNNEYRQQIQLSNTYHPNQQPNYTKQ